MTSWCRGKEIWTAAQEIYSVHVSSKMVCHEYQKNKLFYLSENVSHSAPAKTAFWWVRREKEGEWRYFLMKTTNKHSSAKERDRRERQTFIYYQESSDKKLIQIGIWFHVDDNDANSTFGKHFCRSATDLIARMWINRIGRHISFWFRLEPPQSFYFIAFYLRNLERSAEIKLNSNQGSNWIKEWNAFLSLHACRGWTCIVMQFLHFSEGMRCEQHCSQKER